MSARVARSNGANNAVRSRSIVADAMVAARSRRCKIP
jgi:hypothetical protein